MNFGLNSPQTNKSSEPKGCFRLILQFHLDIEAKIVQKVKKLLAAGFIKPIEHPQWLSNIVPIKKNNEKIRCCLEMFLAVTIKSKWHQETQQIPHFVLLS